MISTYSFVIKFEEFDNNISGLIREASENKTICDTALTVLVSECTKLKNKIIVGLENHSFDQASFRDELNTFIKEIETIRDSAKALKNYNIFVFTNSIIDCWNEFVLEIGPRQKIRY